MQTGHFWLQPPFWHGVMASLVAAGIWWFGGKILEPLWSSVAVNGWPGLVEWLHELGWLAFWVTLALWLVNRRPAPTQAALATASPLFHRQVALAIHSAWYGVGAGEEIDVSETIRKLIDNDRVDARVTNEVMGGDPFPGVHKRLRVVYSFRGGPEQRIEVSEKDRLRIPR